MAFFRRLETMIKADAHGVLDQLEERELLARQHLREAELELDRKRARSEALEEEARRLDEEVRRLGAEAASLDEDVALALGSGKEELARFGARRLLQRRRALEILGRRRAEIAEEGTRLGERLAEQERAFEELRRQVRTRRAVARAADEGLVAPADLAVADEEVELELLRRRRTSREGA